MARNFLLPDLRPEPEKLRAFGFIACGVFGLLALGARAGRGPFAGLGEWSPELAPVLFAVALVSLSFSLAWPRGNRPLWVALSILAAPFGIATFHLLFTALFLFVVGPLALMLRLLGRDPLTRNLDRHAQSYWVTRSERSRPNRYFQRF